MCHGCHACQRGLRVHVPTCQKRASFSFLRANVPINTPTCQRRAHYSIWHANVLTCQRCSNISTWSANVPKEVVIFQLRLRKDVPIFQPFFKGNFQVLDFSVTLNICIAYFKNIRLILENLFRETKSLNFDICKNFIKEKPYQPKAFGVVFNVARWINQTIIQLVYCNFFFPYLLDTPCVKRPI